jgi:hypothetical protein
MLSRAEELLGPSKGGKDLYTALLERFNGTMRERLAILSGRGPYAIHRVAALGAGMWLAGLIMR